MDFLKCEINRELDPTPPFVAALGLGTLTLKYF